MSMLVADCPRCGANSITFDIGAQVFRYSHYGWQKFYEIFSICRQCSSPTIFLVSLDKIELQEAFDKPDALVKYEAALNPYFRIERYISLRDDVYLSPPEHLPENIADAFNEGAACLSIACYNAAATMFRLCLDIATRPLLPDPDDADKPQPNGKQRRDLGLRLPWLFENGLLPIALRDLAQCIREDANDAAHAGNLDKAGAEDVLDFTTVLLERLYTEPERLKLAEERREARREG